MNEREQAITRAFSLYPRQLAVVECLARKSNRSSSNGLQHIITEWSADHPEEWLTIANDGNGQPQEEQETAA